MKLVREGTRTSQDRPSKKVFRKLCRTGAVALTMAALMALGVHLTLADFTAKRSLETSLGTAKRVSQKATQQSTQSSAFSRHFDLDDPTQAWREGVALSVDEASAQEGAASNVVKKRGRSKTVTTMALTTLVVTNTSNSGTGSLRQAIITANSDGMPDQIVFNIPTSDPGFDGSTFTIKPLSNLPSINGGDTLIDGASQTAFTGDSNPAGPEVVINGSLAGTGNGLTVRSPNNTISGLVINGFQVRGIVFAGTSADNNVVVGCYIGTDATGSAAVANTAGGILMNAGADTNHIGGTTPDSRNVISGNGGSGGIFIAGSATGTEGNNTIQGNLIGTNAAGTAALPNGNNGITILGSANNLVGGTAQGAGNVLSGNTQSGVRIAGRLVITSPPTMVTAVFGSTGNTVQGNLLGTNAAGTAAIPNLIDGIRLNFGATNNTVGGTTPAARNVCSGDLAHGVHLDALQPFVEDDNGNPIPIPFQPVSGNTVQGNLIGTDITGALPIGNKLPGVILFFGPTDNLVGGIGQGQGNTIAFNTGGFVDDGNGGMIFVPGDGVNVAYDPNNPNDPNPTVRNRISGNSIHSNQGLGVDLSLAGTAPDAADGPTPNDSCDADAGPNNFQNFPVLTSVQTVGGNTVIQGTLNSASNTTFSVEFFSNTDCDSSGFGEGETFIGAANVTTGGNCNASFSVTLAGTIGCRSVTATATDPNGNTSEFSNCINEAPVVACSVATDQLWPPNHDLIDVGLSAAATDNCPGTVISVQVFSDEDDEAPTDDGNFSPDAKDIATATLRLRAERDGNEDGRVYLIIVTASDSSGNVSRCCQTVTVPKTQSAASKQSVANQAAAAVAFCQQNGTAPPGYFVVGDGPIIGPKQ